MYINIFVNNIICYTAWLVGCNVKEGVLWTGILLQTRLVVDDCPTEVLQGCKLKPLERTWAGTRRIYKAALLLLRIG